MLILGGLLMLGIVALAQEPAEVFRGGTDAVLVPVVVRDGSGKVVRNLTREHFRLLEDDLASVVR